MDEPADPSWLEKATSPDSGRGEGSRPDDKGGISATSIGRWQSELVGRDRDVVERICGPRLRELGYAP
jgi:hypothetical protein